MRCSCSLNVFLCVSDGLSVFEVLISVAMGTFAIATTVISSRALCNQSRVLQGGVVFSVPGKKRLTGWSINSALGGIERKKSSA